MIVKRWKAEHVFDAVNEFEGDLLPGERIIVTTTEACGCEGQGSCKECRGTGYLFDSKTYLPRGGAASGRT